MFERVLHPTDFSKMSEVAFVHALKIALASRGQLSVLHVQPEGDETPSSSFPHVRRTLAAWGLVRANCQPEEIAQLGVRVKKLELEGDDPTEAIASYLDHRPMGLIVLATRQRGGLAHLTHSAVAEPVMRTTGLPSLFIPPASEGFVRVADGVVTLRRVLVPVTQDPDPQAAVDAAHGLARLLAPATLEARVLHVGDETSSPRLSLPEVPGWIWERVTSEGAVVDAVVDAARRTDADLVVLTTRGPRGFLGALRGSTASNVIRACPCPVLAVPRA